MAVFNTTLSKPSVETSLWGKFSPVEARVRDVPQQTNVESRSTCANVKGFHLYSLSQPLTSLEASQCWSSAAAPKVSSIVCKQPEKQKEHTYLIISCFRQTAVHPHKLNLFTNYITYYCLYTYSFSVKRDRCLLSCKSRMEYKY